MQHEKSENGTDGRTRKANNEKDVENEQIKTTKFARIWNNVTEAKNQSSFSIELRLDRYAQT